MASEFMTHALEVATRVGPVDGQAIRRISISLESMESIDRGLASPEIRALQAQGWSIGAIQPIAMPDPHPDQLMVFMMPPKPVAYRVTEVYDRKAIAMTGFTAISLGIFVGWMLASSLGG